MKCPYCGEYMEMYEDYDEYIDDDTLKIEEHWSCSYCVRNFARDVIYKAIEKGMLKE